jgi:hypothetical protein
MRRHRSSIFIAKSGNARTALHFTDGETDMFRNRLDNMIAIRHELMRSARLPIANLTMRSASARRRARGSLTAHRQLWASRFRRHVAAINLRSFGRMGGCQ